VSLWRRQEMSLVPAARAHGSAAQRHLAAFVPTSTTSPPASRGSRRAVGQARTIRFAAVSPESGQHGSRSTPRGRKRPRARNRGQPRTKGACHDRPEGRGRRRPDGPCPDVHRPPALVFRSDDAGAGRPCAHSVEARARRRHDAGRRRGAAVLAAPFAGSVLRPPLRANGDPFGRRHRLPAGLRREAQDSRLHRPVR
jgi:hypothetical protein